MITVRKKDGTDIQVGWDSVIDMRQDGKQLYVILRDRTEGRWVMKEELAAEQLEAELEASRQQFAEGMREAFPDQENELPPGVKKLIETWNKS